MQLLKPQPLLSPEERSQKRKLVFRDTLSLLTLLAVTLALFTATVFLFRSFSNLRARLAQRWLARGEAALQSGQPGIAVEDLRSALAYSPGQRGIEIELAEALAGAGRTQEANSYFNTLWEAEPGSGIINLQLARLAVRQSNPADALEYYRAAIYGTWEGDGTIRRRQVRLELIDYLIGIRRFDQARSELLIAIGNAPEDAAVKLQIAGLMEKAGDPANSAQIYKAMLQHGPSNIAALEGAGRTAFALGNYVQARDYLNRALAHPGSGSETAQARQDLRDLRDEAVQVLLLYPSPSLSELAQAQRTLHDRQMAQARWMACRAGHPEQSAVPEVAALQTRWQQEPPTLKISDFRNHEELRQQELQLTYDTEKVADRYCGSPTGEDALLSRIAANPGAVEAP